MNVTALAGRAMGRVVSAPRPASVPTGRIIELPGRGSTYVVDVPGPEGAPTLLLFHAMGCTAALAWYPSFAALSEHYRVVAFDQRWHGRGIRSPEFRLADCADDAAAVADALGIERFTAVGYSMGGAIAQLVWRRHGARLDGLVLAAIARNLRGSGGERAWFRLTSAAMSRFGDRASARVDGFAAALPAEPRAYDALVSSWAMGEFRSTSMWSMLAVLDEVGHFDSSAWIRRVDVPTSVLVMTRDKAIPASRQRALAAAIPGAMTYDVGGGHASLVLGADEFVPVLVSACRSVSRRAQDRLAG